MALKLKYTDEHGILHINMSPTSTPPAPETDSDKTELKDPQFDTINTRFGSYDIFGGKYEVKNEADDSGETRSLFRSRYNSIEEELANTPYAFATERSLRFAHSPLLDITIERHSDVSPSKDIEDDRFFTKGQDLFGPQVEKSSDEDTPAFTVTQLIHAQDRYFDLSSRQSTQVSVSASDKDNGAFRVLEEKTAVKAVQVDAAPAPIVVVPTAKRKREKSFAILAETPVSRPSSPHSLPVDIRTERVSPFRGRGFREETSRHTTPRTSAANSRASSPLRRRTSSPLRRRTSSLSRIDSMAAATLPPPLPPIQAPAFSLPHTPRDFVRENIEEVRELSELNREKHEEEAEIKRLEEEEALLKEMGLLDQNAKSDAIRSVVCSRTTSRSNSPSKIRIRSRSNSPSTMVLRYENVPEKRFINQEDGMAPAPVTHRSRLGRSVSKSQPQSNDGSPKHSKIPKRQSSVSPNRNSKKTVENGLKNQRFISNSTSSIHETIRIGGQTHDKRNVSKSTQYLNISPAVIKGKPPISPGRGGPPPSNRAINAKRLSPIVGTPNKSPTEDPKSPRTATKPISSARKPVKPAANNTATSRLNSRQPSRALSREPSPDKRRTFTKPSTAKPPTNTNKSRPVARAVSTRTTQKPTVSKTEPKKPINRTNSMKSLIRTPSTKTLNEKPTLLKKRDSKKDLKSQSTSKLDELDKIEVVKVKSPTKSIKEDKPAKVEKDEVKEDTKKITESSTIDSPVTKQDNETQYDKITNEKGELVIMTKKNIISMTTAAITSQPLEVVTKVTNQLPTSFEKAREKGIFERHSSKDSLAPKDEDKDQSKTEMKDTIKEKPEDTQDDKKAKTTKTNTIFIDDNVKLRPLLPPYNNPQVERVKQRIEEILKSPEVSTENITTSAAKTKDKERSTFKNLADKTKSDLKDAKDETTKKFTSIKDQVAKLNEKAAAEKASIEQIPEKIEKTVEKTAAEIRSEASKIVDSIMTPVEEPKPAEKPREEPKKDIEPIVMVVNEKTNGPKSDVIEKMTEKLVKGEAEVEVQSSNMSPSIVDKMAAHNKMADSNDSDKSTHSNGGFPQSTSTTPKPPARTKKEAKEDAKLIDSKESTPESKPPNICQRLMGKCKRCCQCCVKAEDVETEIKDMEEKEEKKRGMMSKLNCCRRNDRDEQLEAEMAAGKAVSIEFESETKRKRKLRDVMCGCCGSKRRVSDVTQEHARDVSDLTAPSVVGETGCCGTKKSDVERRDSILSDRPTNRCCNNRVWTWMRGCCRRQQPEPLSASRRQSLFSKNKSLSPTLPPEDTRTKLDASLVEHTSMIRGAIPVLPIMLSYFCLICNIFVPGLGTIFSGLFCLCFGIPRFGVHDGAKHRIGAFVINLLVGCGQLFTVLFCLVGWGWSIWWGVIMVKTARKYRKLKAEEALQEAEAPPVTANNHTRA